MFDDDAAVDAAVLEAYHTATVYRNMHEYPMTKVALGVTSMIKTVTRDDTIRAGQRHKRLRRIMIKLVREPTMRLSQMEDIGGCRAILRDLQQVRRVGQRIGANWPDAQPVDYIATPKPDGYRALHFIARRDERLIEIQLRTPRQDEWARAIEDYSPIVGFDLKSGEGPDDLKLYFKLAADWLAMQDRGELPTGDFLEAFDTIKERVRPYFARRPT